MPADFASAFSSFRAGDLLVSLRNCNLLLVLDAETNLIKWWCIGAWVRQHDPDWRADRVISLFDNNADGTRTGQILGSSRIIEIVPGSPGQRVVYGGDGAFFHSSIRGKHQFLGEDRVLITDAEAGRVIEVEDGAVAWEFVNAFDETFAARVSEARVYKKDYFSVQDWSCAPS